MALNAEKDLSAVCDFNVCNWDLIDHPSVPVWFPSLYSLQNQVSILKPATQSKKEILLIPLLPVPYQHWPLPLPLSGSNQCFCNKSIPCFGFRCYHLQHNSVIWSGFLFIVMELCSISCYLSPSLHYFKDCYPIVASSSDFFILLLLCRCQSYGIYHSLFIHSIVNEHLSSNLQIW